MAVISKKDLPDKQNPAKSQRPSVRPGSRNEELAGKPSLQATLNDLYNEIENGFQDQGQRSDDNEKWWDIYNTKLSDNQFYNGNSQIYVPIVYDAVNARKTRFVNQIFPQNGRYVQVITEDGKIPDATVSLLEYYIRLNNLRNIAIPALMKNGDVEGQYTIYVDWTVRTRDVVYRVEVPLGHDMNELNPDPMDEDEAIGDDMLEGEEDEEEILADPDETITELKEETLKIGFPSVEVISDNDLLVLPATCDSIDEALECGGSVTIIRRWSKDTIKQKIADGEIDEEAGNMLVSAFTKEDDKSRRDTAKQAVDAAGIKRDARGVYALVYETWAKLTVKGKKRIYKIFFGGAKRNLSCKRNPLWCDKVPIISSPVNKAKGSFKGKSMVQPVATFQWAANDAVNEGMDSAAYAMLPIIMTDPEKNPHVGSLVLSLAAIWMTNPKDTQFAQFPQLWKDAFEIVGAARAQIFQSLSVNPAAITQTTSSKQPTQADVANEQQVDILTTADAVTSIEEGILTPMLQLMLELDHQFRSDPLTIYQHGKLGIEQKIEKVPLTRLDITHYMKWFGVEAARNAQAIQQQIAAANVLRGIPPQLYPGYQLDLTPVITQLVENAFGPNLAPLVFKDMRKEQTIDPMIENELLLRGNDLPVHPLDNMQQHMQAHIQALQASGDPLGNIQAHMMQHMIVAQMAAAQPAGGVPGTPGGAGPGIPGQPGAQAPGTPRMGAQVDGPRTQGPPGMMAPDMMSDPNVMPG